MNEVVTRAELIDPRLKACSWGVLEGSKALREYSISQLHSAYQLNTLRAETRKLKTVYQQKINNLDALKKIFCKRRMQEN